MASSTEPVGVRALLLNLHRETLILGQALQLPEGELGGNALSTLDPRHSRQPPEARLLLLQTTAPGVGN